MSDGSLGLGEALRNVDFDEVFADTPLGGEFEEHSSTAETVGEFLGRRVGAWLGGLLGGMFLAPMLDGGNGSEDDESEDDGSEDDGDANEEPDEAGEES